MPDCSRPTIVRRTVRQAEISRAIKAAQNAGLTVSSVKVGYDGTIEVVTAAKASNPDGELDAWRAKRDAGLELHARAAGRVHHDPEVDRVLAAAEGADWSDLRPARGARTMTPEEVAAALSLSVTFVERAAETGQLERYRSSRLCFTPTGVKRSVVAAIRRARR